MSNLQHDSFKMISNLYDLKIAKLTFVTVCPEELLIRCNFTGVFFLRIAPSSGFDLSEIKHSRIRTRTSIQRLLSWDNQDYVLVLTRVRKSTKTWVHNKTTWTRVIRQLGLREKTCSGKQT